MSAKQTQPVSLSRVQDRIAGLLADLDATVEQVHDLTREGEDERAVELLDRQRASMYKLVDQISREVAASTPSRWAILRRHMSAAAVAALFAVGALAMSVSALTGTNPIQDARIELERASRLVDPAARLQVIVKVYRSTRALPSNQTVALDRSIAEQARNVADDLDDNNADPTLKDQASQIAADLSQGKPPPPPPAPSGDRPPTDVVKALLPE